MAAAVPPQALGICKRCSENPSVINLRTEHLCSGCFDKYLRSRCIKRVEKYRVRYNPPDQDISPRRLLLPVSFGISSTTLLHVLDRQLKTQLERTGRTGFALLVVYIDESAIDPSVPPPSSLQALQDRFPSVGEYLSAPLEEIYNFPSASRSFELHAPSSTQHDNKAKLQALLSSLASPSSRMDILHILRTRLVTSLARRHNCDAVLWGDSVTRLAEKTLAETAKGRGFSLLWQIEDGDSPYGVEILYPLRDILKKEIAIYITLDLPTPLAPLCVGFVREPKYPAAGKGITVDELMTQYFAVVEGQYPSVVANVVRTVGKLVTEDGVVILERCRICGLPKDGGSRGLVLAADARDGRKSEGENRNTNKLAESNMCYGCARSVHGAKPYEWPLD